MSRKPRLERFIWQEICVTWQDVACIRFTCLNIVSIWPIWWRTSWSHQNTHIFSFLPSKKVLSGRKLDLWPHGEISVCVSFATAVCRFQSQGSTLSLLCKCIWIITLQAKYNWITTINCPISTHKLNGAQGMEHGGTRERSQLMLSFSIHFHDWNWTDFKHLALFLLTLTCCVSTLGISF